MPESERVRLAASLPQALVLHMAASDEAALIVALPHLRRDDGRGEVWISTGPFHALDTTVVIELAPAKPTGDGRSVTAAAQAEGFHVNLQLLPGHPDYAAILAAAEPYRVNPTTPRRVFA